MGHSLADGWRISNMICSLGADLCFQSSICSSGFAPVLWASDGYIQYPSNAWVPTSPYYMACTITHSFLHNVEIKIQERGSETAAQIPSICITDFMHSRIVFWQKDAMSGPWVNRFSLHRRSRIWKMIDWLIDWVSEWVSVENKILVAPIMELSLEASFNFWTTIALLKSDWIGWILDNAHLICSIDFSTTSY